MNPPPLVIDIEKDMVSNADYRRVIHTTPLSQLVLMSIAPLQNIGMEVHEDGDQFIKIEAGEGMVYLDGATSVVSDGFSISIPAGTHHDIANLSETESLKLYVIYSPPEHPHGLVQPFKE